MSKRLVLCSGGVDSAVMLRAALAPEHEVSVLFYEYGQQAAQREWAAVLRLLRAFGLPRKRGRRVQLPFPHLTEHHHPLADGSGINYDATQLDIPETTTGALPQGYDTAHIVPYRNIVFLTHAYSYAATAGFDEIWCGFDGSAAYPAADEDFGVLDALQRLCNGRLREGWQPISLMTPASLPGSIAFDGNSRPMAWRGRGTGQAGAVALGGLLGVPFEMCWSCSNALAKPCGVCGKCLDRLIAFTQLGERDPASYTPLRVMFKRFEGQPVRVGTLAEQAYAHHGMLPEVAEHA